MIKKLNISLLFKLQFVVYLFIIEIDLSLIFFSFEKRFSEKRTFFFLVSPLRAL